MLWKLKPITFSVFSTLLKRLQVLPVPVHHSVHTLLNVGVKTCKPFKQHSQTFASRIEKGKMTMEVIKSTNDKRNYRVIKLENSLTALLISDPVKSEQKVEEYLSTSDSESDSDSSDEHAGNDLLDMDVDDDKSPKNSSGEKKSAAALCIGVGSFSDPPDIPGFAHFLEHMVFMGSEKYPKENDMDDYLGKHGGDSNAWTDCERTTFYFEIQKKNFHKALDKFAHFFISPLMLKDSVDREIQAVDSEFQMSLTNDSDRFNQLLGTTAAPSHPMSRFMSGNLKTLKTDPDARGINVYDKLRGFYERHYSSHYMTLAVQSQESLDTLQELVIDTFSSVPHNKLPKPSFAEFKEPFDTKKFTKFYKIIPMEDSHKLQITWALPSLLEHYRVKPLEYLATLVGHEGKGSILSYLKKKIWALEVSCGNSGYGFDHNSTWSAFYVEIILTESGMQHIYEVLTAVFQYVAMLQKNGPQRQIYLEQQQIEECKFRWKEQGEAMDYVESVSESMQLFPPKHFLTGKHLLVFFDEQLIAKCTDCLQPHLANISLESKSFEDLGVCNREEPWYGTKYCVTDIDPIWLRKWKNIKTIPELYLPEANPFIATDFRLMKRQNSKEHPYKIIENNQCLLWYKLDSKFNVPKGFVYFHLMSPIVSESVQNSTLMDLFINILLHTLNESVYPAVLAGMEYSVEGFITGIVLQMAGFNHKLPILVKAIVDHIADFTFSEDAFDAISNELKRSYYNEMIKPYDLAKMVRFSMLEPNNQPSFERYRMITSLTGKMLTEFVKNYKKHLFIEGFVIGNFLPKDATEMGDYIQSKLCQSTLPEDKIPKKLLLEIPKGKLSCRVLGVNKKDSNCCITNYYQSVPGNLRNCCINELLGTRMREPCFDFLRTKHQLGYSVFCRSTVTNGILGLSVTVESQTSKFSLAHIDEKITEFLEQFRSMLDKMTQDEFNNLVNSLITDKQSEDLHMGEEAHRCWNQIHDHFYVFDILQKEISILKTLTLSDLKHWYRQYIGKNQKKLSCQVEGTVTAMETEDRPSPDVGTQHKETTTLTFLSSDEADVKYVTDIEHVKRKLKVLPYTRITS